MCILIINIVLLLSYTVNGKRNKQSKIWEDDLLLSFIRLGQLIHFVLDKSLCSNTRANFLIKKLKRTKKVWVNNKLYSYQD